ncbi:helix-turn-helix domain-containing protein [Myroides sp. LJL115]
MFFKSIVFLGLGAPFIIYYGPFFFYFITGLCKDTQGCNPANNRIRYHFILPVLVSVLYIGALFFVDSLSVKFLVYYYLWLYLLTGFLLIGYGIYGYVFLMQATFKIKFRLFLLGIIWFMLFMAIIIIAIGVYNAIPNNDMDKVIYGMLILSFLIFNYCRQKISIPSSKEEQNEIKQVDDYQSKAGNNVGNTLQENTTEAQVATKYIKSQLSQEYLQACQSKIEYYTIEKQYYKQVDFNVEMLRSLSGIPKYHIAQAFSVLYGMNFNSFVNEKRIEYALLIMDQENYTIPISELTERCGFNSRTSFFRAFKKYTNLSPSQYMDEQRSSHYKS